MDCEAAIIGFFTGKGKRGDIRYDEDLFAGGFVDSLFALEIVVFLEETFKFRLKNKDITEENFRTVSAIAELVRKNVS